MRGKEDLSLCMWKEKGVNEREREKDGHKNQIQINIFFLWKMKGVVEKKKSKKKKEEEEGGPDSEEFMLV